MMNHSEANHHITLIGMAGVGKSTLGKRIAKQLEMAFVDIDTLIQEKTGHSLQTLLNEKGSQGFLDIEEETVLTLPLIQKTIISPGGSVIYCKKAMEKLKTISKIIYLKDTLENIQTRIPNLHTRGIVGIGDQSLEDLFKQREDLYNAYADAIITLTGKSEKTILEELEKECVR